MRVTVPQGTPSGTDGPKAGWAHTDLTLAAASGAASLTGDEDRPPLRVTVPQGTPSGKVRAASPILERI